MKVRALAASAALSALFVVVYSVTNWFTGTRAGVPSFFWPWERSIPFVPLLILPYMSIDLFFIAAPFLAKTPRALKTLCLRITVAILAAGAGFLIFPLKFAFERPDADGPFGLIFNNFRALDLPYNEFPSLHVALWLILIDLYARRTRGPARLAILAWFALILPSTMFTYQHHLIDILGGFALGVLCLHFIDDQPLRAPFQKNPRIAAYYLLAAITLAALAFTWQSCTLILLYPAVSLLLVSIAYVLLGPKIFRKHHGRMPWTTYLLFWPSLLGQYLSLRHYARRSNACDKLTDHVWIGRRLSSAEARDLLLTAVIDLTSELPESRACRALAYLELPILDLTAPLPQHIHRALAFIQQHEQTGIVYIHCKAGYSRTAVIAGAYLLATRRAQNVDDAVAILKRTRPAIVIRPEALDALTHFAAAPASPSATPSPAATAAAQMPTA